MTEGGKSENREDEEQETSKFAWASTALKGIRILISSPVAMVIGFGLGIAFGLPYIDRVGLEAAAKTKTVAGYMGVLLGFLVVLYFIVRNAITKHLKRRITDQFTLPDRAVFEDWLKEQFGEPLGARLWSAAGDITKLLTNLAGLIFAFISAGGMLATIVGLFVAVISLMALAVAQEELEASRWANFLLCEQNSLIRSGNSSKFATNIAAQNKYDDAYQTMIELEQIHEEVRQLAPQMRTQLEDAQIGTIINLSNRASKALESATTIRESNTVPPQITAEITAKASFIEPRLRELSTLSVAVIDPTPEVARLILKGFGINSGLAHSIELTAIDTCDPKSSAADFNTCVEIEIINQVKQRAPTFKLRLYDILKQFQNHRKIDTLTRSPHASWADTKDRILDMLSKTTQPTKDDLCRTLIKGHQISELERTRGAAH